MKITALKEFNKPQNTLFISNYPTFDNKGVMGNINGVSKYTYNLLSKLKKDLELEGGKAIVLCDAVDKKTSYKEDGLLIVRGWKKDDRKVFRDICKIIKKFDQVDKIFIQFEFNEFGNLSATLMFPLFLCRLKLLRRNVSLLLHQVVEDLGELDGHLNLKPKSLKIKVMNKGMSWFYKKVLNISDKVVVHNNLFKKRLESITKKGKIFVIPHGMIDSSEECDLQDPREKLGLKKKDFIILSFGFLTWYKGSDLIAKNFVNYYKKTKDDSIKLLLAGGPSANLRNRKFYKKYYSDLVKLIKGYPNIIHTGFIPDNEVKDYYCAADVVVFPYRTHMSASGPFSLALSYDRPFLISDKISSVLETRDIKKVMSNLGLTERDIVFKLNKPSDLFVKIGNLVQSKKRRDKLSKLSQKVKNERDWERTAEKFLFVINA